MITLHDNDGLHEQRGIVLKFDLGMHLSLDNLRREVAQVQDRFQVEANIAQIIGVGLGHLDSSL